MKLRSMHDNDIETISKWMSQKENYKWLDFGAGEQLLEGISIRMMSRKERHDFQVFTPDGEADQFIGIVVLSDISPMFYTATLWYVLGEKAYTGRNYTTRAVNQMLTRAFDELNLQTVFAWAVDRNVSSVRVLQKNNFRLIGRRRKCHYVEGQFCDRLLFDLLHSEHKKIQS